MLKSKESHPVSLIAFLFSILFLTFSAFLYPKWIISGTEATLSWDVMGYYLYLPSYFYDDISKLHNLQHILDTYHPVDGFGNAFQLPSGNYMMKYSIGMALMYLPFFGVAHLWAHAGGYAVDGFSYPYQVMISFGSILVAWIGLWFARKNLLKHFDDRITAVVLLVLVLATNYFNYVSYAGPMSHNYLFTIYCLVIWLTIKWYEKPSITGSVVIGFLCGLATVTRPTEIIILIIPFVWGINLWKGIPERLRLLWQHRLKLCISAVAFGIAILPQVLYWKRISGEWVYYSYQDQGFDWTQPHLYFGMLTFKNGWLVYTPVMALALIGLLFLYIRRKEIFWPVFIFMLINIYIVYSWQIWWYGGSFGSRAMVQSYALLIFPLAAFFDFVRDKKIMRTLIGIGVIFCCWLNLLQTYQAHADGIFEAENMTRAYYWRIFGKTSIEQKDKKLLDSKEEMPAPLDDQLQVVYKIKSPVYDSVRSKDSYAAGLLIQLSDSQQFSKSYAIPVDHDKELWLRASAAVYFPDKEWDVWGMTQFTLKLFSHQQEVRNNIMRIQRATDQGSWQYVTVDIHSMPSMHADNLQVSFWNANSKKKIFIDDLRVEQVILK
ncbi:MAG: hypothetical protein IPO83_09725 [Chitinophagaceae bacterium]|nr:hypothetical protein [Chitinophagaceae bacterium]